MGRAMKLVITLTYIMNIFVSEITCKTYNVTNTLKLKILNCPKYWHLIVMTKWCSSISLDLKSAQSFQFNWIIQMLQKTALNETLCMLWKKHTWRFYSLVLGEWKDLSSYKTFHKWWFPLEKLYLYLYRSSICLGKYG